MIFKFDDIGQVCASFYCDDGVNAGDPCSIVRNRTINTTREDEAFIGKVLSVRNNVASVAVGGFVTLSFTGSAPGTGYANLSGNGNGGIMVCNDGKTYLVVSVDAVNKTATILL